ncbi:MAG TPA: VWA domain-containing protein [Bryobacteraceae bacterium]|nr:VWA domain-containing protein [Bryobacteraceae bacterium]
MKALPVVGCLTLSLALSQTTPPPLPAPPPQQQTQPPQQTPANPNQPEMSTHEETTTSFHAHVNLVTVPVVARDARGKAVGNLTKENFQLFDKGKLQEISRFSVEKVGAAEPLEANAAPGIPASSEEPKGQMVVVPERFVAYVFDDLHLAFGDLSRVREAAVRSLEELKPTDRAAVCSLSSGVVLDFTDDRAQLRDAMFHLRPNSMTRVGAMTDQYQLTMGTLKMLRGLVQRLAGAPGQRSMVLVSPGFFTIIRQQGDRIPSDPFVDEKNEILDGAIRANVIINAMDARGLYTDPALDASRSSGRGLGTGLMRESMRADILAELADGTGGHFWQNSNNYDEGFKNLAAAPEYVYLIGFSPQNLKSDGSFHALRVVVKPSSNLSIQARKGYYAPRKVDDEAETARQEIESALYSREERSELPMDMHTQFFKTDAGGAKLAVMVHLGLKQFRFRKADGRNNNVVTMVTGIFDRNGHWVEGVKKVLELHLKDETLSSRLNRGLTIRTSFDVAPGTYVIRQVVRDAEGQLMSATNGAVFIP